MRTDFSLEIAGNWSEILVRPYIDGVSDRSRVLIASFEVDGMEMIGAARIALEPGKNHVPFPYAVRIVHPGLWQPNGCGEASFYLFSVAFHRGGAPVHLLKKQRGIRFVDADRTRHILCVNGKQVALRGCDPDFSLPEADFASRLRATDNLVFLSDADPEVDAKLARCSRRGLLAALELTGGTAPEHFLSHPSVCLFVARPGGNGERRYRAERQNRLPPMFSPEELNLFLQLK